MAKELPVKEVYLRFFEAALTGVAANPEYSKLTSKMMVINASIIADYAFESYISKLAEFK